MFLDVPRCSLWSSATSISDGIFPEKYFVKPCEHFFPVWCDNMKLPLPHHHHPHHPHHNTIFQLGVTVSSSPSTIWSSALAGKKFSGLLWSIKGMNCALRTAHPFFPSIKPSRFWMCIVECASIKGAQNYHFEKHIKTRLLEQTNCYAHCSPLILRAAI